MSEPTPALAAVPPQPRAAEPSVLARALEERELYQAFQPIVHLATKQIYGYEALARSNNPAFKNPYELFKAAIEEHRVGELGHYLRMVAVDACTEWPLFLNVNPHEFDEGYLVRPDDPIFWHERPVYIEVLESVPLSHFALCRSVLAEARAKGILLAIDDLGAGYSNLKYIADLTPEIVKLDRELIAGVVFNSRQHTLMRSIVQLCHQMGAAVVAEGIETLDELHAVIDTGADYGQGFLFARPALPAPAAPWPE
jgi:EAL domain-containing protein (putative c-di-GMP-specific phosphodiesterase class I)